jgi:ribosome-binding factor A
MNLAFLRNGVSHMSRADKVAEEIKKEVSLIVQDELKDPRLGFITITRTELTQDLRFARIYYSVYGDEKQWQDTKEGLENAAGFVRHMLGERFTLRYVPEIVFVEDHSCEYGIRIEEKLGEIKNENRDGKNSFQQKGSL